MRSSPRPDGGAYILLGAVAIMTRNGLFLGFETRASLSYAHQISAVHEGPKPTRRFLQHRPEFGRQNACSGEQKTLASWAWSKFRGLWRGGGGGGGAWGEAQDAKTFFCRCQTSSAKCQDKCANGHVQKILDLSSALAPKKEIAYLAYNGRHSLSRRS